MTSTKQLDVISFTKYSACGNDFLLFETDFIPNKAALSSLCTRRTGVGADGIIFVCPSDSCDRMMRIFNADGNEAEMCGNGIRCVAHYIFDSGIAEKKCQIESMHRIHTATKQNELIHITMGPPQDIIWETNIAGHQLTTLNTGVPHAVLFKEDIDKVNLEILGKELQKRPEFAPNSINVNIAEQHHNTLRVRTFERGVGETLACGTGATATAIAASYKFKIPPPISVMLKSGDTLTIDFTIESNKIDNVSMTGPCKVIYKGTIEKLL
ncbi:MAG: diaminopimelate epimerase [Chlamydiota bacterium]|nr:diaminopimelate epimerase [Chlamydiota bacterium]